MILAIVVAELSLWLVIFLGLTVRYVFGLRRLGGASKENRPKLYGSDKVRHEWKETLRWWAACALSISILGLCVLVVQDHDESMVFYEWIARLALVGAAAVVIPIMYSIWPKTEPR